MKWYYSPNENDNAAVREGIVAFNARIIGEREKPLAIFLKNDSGEIVGGVQAWFDHESVWIDVLQGQKTTWQGSPVWVHGDVSPGNLLISDGQLSAVIDFGQLAIGDPACDLAITWTFFKDESREIFRNNLQLDSNTWVRGRAWTLWKALITAAGITNPNNAEAKECWRIIDDVINDYKQEKK